METALKIAAAVVGAVAVVLYGLGYWQKKRRNIVLLGAISRVLYVAQYLLLGEISGAVMDVVSATGALLAGQRIRCFLKTFRGLCQRVLSWPPSALAFRWR